MKEKWKYVVTGAFGSGGGLFLVPLMTRWSKLEERKAFATSVAIILSLSIVSSVVYFTKGALDFSTAWPYLLGGGIGGVISGLVFQKVPLNFLRRIFGLLILYGGIRAVLAL